MQLHLSEEIVDPKGNIRINIDNDWYINDFENRFAYPKHHF